MKIVSGGRTRDGSGLTIRESILNLDNILAEHGLVIVKAADVRMMMDYFSIAASFSKTEQTTEAYRRLFEILPKDTVINYGY